MNFSAGPGKQDKDVVRRFAEKIAEESLLELSHRSDEFLKILTQTKQNLRTLFCVPDDMEILFVSAGSSYQFLQCAANLLIRKGAYLITGEFASLAYQNACFYGDCEILYDNQSHPYDLSDFPEEIESDADYVYVCVNNSLYGTRTPDFRCNRPIVADVSSCLGIEELDLSRYALCFASAQKNFGLSGMSLVFLRKDLQMKDHLPDLLSYRKLIEHDSLLNTPAIASIALCGMTAQNMLHQKELILNENKEKASLFYDYLDQSDFYFPLVQKHRSWMNAVFALKTESLEKSLVQFLKKHQVTGIQGHRKTGHCRASFNAHVSLEEVKKLIELLEEFRLSQKNITS